MDDKCEIRILLVYFMWLLNFETCSHNAINKSENFNININQSVYDGLFIIGFGTV